MVFVYHFFQDLVKLFFKACRTPPLIFSLVSSDKRGLLSLFGFFCLRLRAPVGGGATVFSSRGLSFLGTACLRLRGGAASVSLGLSFLGTSCLRLRFLGAGPTGAGLLRGVISIQY